MPTVMKGSATFEYFYLILESTVSFLIERLASTIFQLNVLQICPGN